jgi:multidrug transporter EmrE-like cation transporter
MTHEYFDLHGTDAATEGLYFIIFLMLTSLSFTMLLLCHCVPKSFTQRLLIALSPSCASVDLISLSRSIDNIAVGLIYFCFSGLILVLTIHTKESPTFYAHQGNHDSMVSIRNMIHTHLGCAIHNEFMFYVMINNQSIR